MPTIIEGTRDLLTKIIELFTASHSGSLSVDPFDGIETFASLAMGVTTQTAIFTPSSGKAFTVHGINVSSDSNIVDVTVEFVASNTLIYHLNVSNFTTAGVSLMHIDGAIDEPIKMTAAADTFILVNVHEI